MATVPGPLVRRTLSVPALLLALVVTVALTPAAVLLSVVVDAALDRGTPWRRTRLWFLVVTALLIEATGLVRAARLRPDDEAGNYDLELWWVGRHARNLRRHAGVRWFVENPELLERGNTVVIAQHASHADAILPVLAFGNRGGLRVRYTLKDTLQWLPAMDIVGNRTHNLFIDRTPGPDSPVLGHIEELAADLDDHSAAVIFPEGTFYSPERLDRAATRLGRTRPDLEPDARTLRFLLPPRPAGSLAMLRGAPHADVTFLAHEALTGFSSLRDILRRGPLDQKLRVRLWRIPRAEVPTDDKELVTWLLGHWLEMDRWIGAPAGARAAVTTGQEIIT